jgi:hypothetical protein
MCPSPNIIRVVKSKRVILVRHMACARKTINILMVLVGIPGGNNYV